MTHVFIKFDGHEPVIYPKDAPIPRIGDEIVKENKEWKTETWGRVSEIKHKLQPNGVIVTIYVNKPSQSF